MTRPSRSPEPWSAATAAAAAGVCLVGLDALRDAARINRVIDLIWGEQHVHPDLLRALEHAGAILVGAEDPAGELVGYAWGFIGFDAGRVHLHSHMAAVLPAWQGRGVGYAMKLEQRARALDLGLDEIRWTYDPMLSRNAWFNLVKLGGVAERFLPDFYGDMMDKQNAGDRSDRFEVRWRLTSRRTVRALAGAEAGPPSPPSDALWLVRPGEGPDGPAPEETGAVPEPARAALVAIPRDHQDLRRRAPQVALAWRRAAREAFSSCFGAGLVAGAIDRQGVYVFQPAAAVRAVDGRAEGVDGRG